jgi:hypothetical protein
MPKEDEPQFQAQINGWNPVNDIVSTDSILEAMRALIARAGERTTAVGSIAIGSDSGTWPEVVHLAHLPLSTSR